MADNNNLQVVNLPEQPNPALKKLDRLIGEWQVSGGIEGIINYEWMDGGFYLIQKFDLFNGRKIKGIEYIGFDEDTQTLRSHLMDNNGANFTYTWEMNGNELKIWFGDKDSDNFMIGQLSDDGNSAKTKWQWPGGGYSAEMKRTS